MSSTLIHIEVHFTPTELDEMQLRGKNVVVIDVLRASATVATALQNGAKEIIPVSDIENAVKVSSSLFGGVTLRAGERNGKMIEGFNLGNSPSEFTVEAVKGKSIIFLTTNGSKAMLKGRYAQNLIVCGFVNLSSVVKKLIEIASDVVIICAGQDNHFCLEDAVCAGKIVNHLKKEKKLDIHLDDGARAASAIDATFGKNIPKMLKLSEHGKYLADIGFADDLKVCASLNTIPVVPMLSGNVIRLLKESFKVRT